MIIEDSKRPHGQAVKTSPSHGGIWGSIPHGGTKKILHISVGFLLINFSLIPWGICTPCVRGFATRTPEHWAGVSLYEWTHSLHYYVHYVLYDSHGGTKKTSPSRACFSFSHGELHTLCAQPCCTNPRTLKTHNVITLCKLFIFIFRKWGNLIVNCWGLV